MPNSRKSLAALSLLFLLFEAPISAGEAGQAAAAGPPLTSATLLKSADLRSDLALLRRTYELLHPGLLRYLTEAEVAALFAEADRYFAADRTLGETFLALTRLTAAFRCGHSYPNFFNQSDAVAEALFSGVDKLPFEFRWISGRMIVSRDSSKEALPPGTEILSIDGVPVASILAALLPLARADGGNDAKRVAYLEIQGEEQFQAFDILYPLLYPLREDSFALVLRRPGQGSEETLRLAPGDGVGRHLGNEEAESSPKAALWTYEEKQGLGILRMPTWALYDSEWDYVAFTEALMRDLVERQVPDLVLDLRANEGGLDAGNAILAHLIDKEIELPRYDFFVRYRKAPEDLVPFLDTWDPSFRDWGKDAVGPVDARFYRLERWAAAGRARMLEPKAPRYRGRVWVLVGPVNSSATFQFALTIQQSGVAKLVGQPTGGNRRGINGSAFFFVRLPKTGLEVDLPLVAGMPPTPQPDAGVVPDFLVEPQIADIVAGIDPELELVRQQIALSAATSH